MGKLFSKFKNMFEKNCNVEYFPLNHARTDETMLMAELGPPPPWPIFKAINMCADLLRKVADKLTHPRGGSHQMT